MLLGRHRERQALEALLADARAGRSAVVALVGEAGIGKSALLDWAERQARGMRVLRARGVQSEAQIPFAGLFELLRPALDCLDRIPLPQAAALESALALRPARAEDRFAVGAATLSLLAAHAEPAPLVLLVDDAQWLDGSSADALLFAARRLLADPIAVVLTVREGEPSLLDGSDLPTLRLAGLDEEASAELVRGRAPSAGADLAARLHRETGGNPLALLELAAAPAPVVTSVASAYLQRAIALPERTQAALVLAAASDGGDLALLARTAGWDAEDLTAAEEAGLIAVRDGRLEFRHPLARSAIYADATPERRRTAHRALADALPDAEADRRAWHLALAAVGPDEAASSALEQAGLRAHERSAYDVASRSFERAARLAPDEARRAFLLHAAADAAWLGGLAARTGALLDEAAAQAPAGPVALAIEHLRGSVALRRGPLDVGRAILSAAAERAADRDPARAIEMLADAAQGAFYAGDAAGMRACGERAAALAAGVQGPAAFFARMTGGMALILSGEGEGGASEIRAAAAALESSDDLASEPRTLVWAAMGPLWLREAGGRELVDRAVATARARAAVGVLPNLLTHVAIDQAATERWVEAQAGFEEAIDLARETGQLTVLTGALSRLAWLEARLGREDAARAHADEALAAAREHGVGVCEIWALAALGELELVLGNVDAALERFEELQAALARRGIADVDVSPAPELVELHLRRGRREAAEAAAGTFAGDAGAKRQPWALARAARTRALLADEDCFGAFFDEALDLHARTADVFETARTLLAYGARLRRAGRRVESRERLRAAIEAFDDLGAAPWAGLARTELAATGETARRRVPTTLGELTPQELQVSLLLAEGKTTREAAAALFLSPKTIEYHLRNAYRKLAIHSREELRAALRSNAAG